MKSLFVFLVFLLGLVLAQCPPTPSISTSCDNCVSLDANKSVVSNSQTRCVPAGETMTISSISIGNNATLLIWGTLIFRGDKSKQGNVNIRLVNLNNKWYLRVNLGNGKYVWAMVIRPAKRKTDKWVGFISDIEHAAKTGDWFPYTVRLKLRNGKIYAQFSKEEKLPEVSITKDNGVIGIDINAYPFHLSLVHTTKDGNLEKYERIN